MSTFRIQTQAENTVFWFCATVLFTANLRCDRATAANADALAVVAEAVITECNLSKKATVNIRRAVRKSRKSRRDKNANKFALEIGGVAPLTVVRQRALVDAVRALDVSQISPAVAYPSGLGPIHWSFHGE